MSKKENKLTPLYEQVLTLQENLENIRKRVRGDRILSFLAGLVTGVSIGLFISVLISWLCEK